MKNLVLSSISALALLASTQSGVTAPPPPVSTVTFNLLVNPAFKTCLGPGPVAVATVTRGSQNDKMVLQISGIKANLQFDVFTVQRSSLTWQGLPVQGFAGFGLAWYQSDLEADSNGNGVATINTILLDQIFGFDADLQADGKTSKLKPTQTTHVGFWFNDPHDAAACGFDVSKPTPFNGNHNAGPLAMISVPVQGTPAQLGPLCTSTSGHTQEEADADTTGTIFVCNP